MVSIQKYVQFLRRRLSLGYLLVSYDTIQADEGLCGEVFRPRNHIRHRILKKFGVLMGTMVPHHVPDFFQEWPPDGREIGDSRYAKHVCRARYLEMCSW